MTAETAQHSLLANGTAAVIPEGDSEPLIPLERLRALEVGLNALDRLLSAQQQSTARAIEAAIATRDEQIRSLIATRDRFAEVTAVQKLESHLGVVEDKLAELAAVVMPRAEINLLLANVNTHSDGISERLAQFGQVVVALRSSLSTKETEAEAIAKHGERVRTAVFGVIGAVISVALVILAVVTFTRETHTPTPVTTTTTTTTTVAR